MLPGMEWRVGDDHIETPGNVGIDIAGNDFARQIVLVAEKPRT